VAVLVAGIPTLGTPVEISAALALGKPTVVFTDIIGSVQLAAWANSGATIIDLNDPDLDPAIPEASDLRAMLLFAPDVLPGEAPEGMDPMYVKYAPGARPLTKANSTDAGFDIATLEETLVHSGVRAMLRTGIQASVPDGWWGQITARSSTMLRWNLRVHDAVIDAGYTGELLLGVTYCGVGNAVIPASTRLAQYILHPVWGGEIEVVDVLPEHVRGENGYGSSGL
jgi:dUTP pyrophosphatase